MSFNASDLLKLVQDFGETLTLRKVTTGGTYDASTVLLVGVRLRTIPLLDTSIT